eukprot:87893_1
MSSSARKALTIISKRAYYIRTPAKGYPKYQPLYQSSYRTPQRAQPPPPTPFSRPWKLPETDEDIERYLMKWSNVVGHEFLENMRSQIIKWGTHNLSEKQKTAIRNCVSHKSTRVRRALYPTVLTIDPTMKDLLVLSDKDFETVAAQDKKAAETLKQFKTALCDRGSLSYKQLKYAASLLNQFFDTEPQL